MRKLTRSPSQPASHGDADATGQVALASAALRTTRAALARWTGELLPTSALARGPLRISPQARWLAQAQRDLAAWINDGGFCQPGERGAHAGPGCGAPAAPVRACDTCTE